MNQFADVFPLKVGFNLDVLSNTVKKRLKIHVWEAYGRGQRRILYEVDSCFTAGASGRLCLKVVKHTEGPRQRFWPVYWEVLSIGAAHFLLSTRLE